MGYVVIVGSELDSFNVIVVDPELTSPFTVNMLINPPGVVNLITVPLCIVEEVVADEFNVITKLLIAPTFAPVGSPLIATDAPL